MSTTSQEARAEAVSQLLSRLNEGDSAAADNLLPVVYSELRSLARARMAREPEGHTLQPTALVHEAYLRLVGDGDPSWRGRAHFFGAAALAMRRILIERARRVRRIRHGGELKRVTLDDQLRQGVAVDAQANELLDLDRALTKLAEKDARMARVVELRFFGGLEVEEVAKVLDASRRTVERAWTGARAWLRLELDRSNETTSEKTGDRAGDGDGDRADD